MTTNSDSDAQAAFIELAKSRLADPMLVEGERTESTLDPGVEVIASSEGSEPLFEFDEAPGDFENDVISRLENIENLLNDVNTLHVQTHTVMENIVNQVEKIMHQVEPTIQLITESKFFRMFVPQAKGGK